MSGRRSSRLSNAPAIIRTTIHARARRSSMVPRRAPWPRCRSRSWTASWRWRNRSPAASALFRADACPGKTRRKCHDERSHAKHVRRRHRGGWGVRGFGAADDRAGLGNAGSGPMPEILRQYAPVTAARLKNPEDGNWLMFRRTFDGWGYSPLGEITPANVSRLQPVWSFATGQTEGHEAPPVVNNGVMFVATPGNQLLALEARTGKVLWRYKRPFPEDMTPLHPTSRGVGLYGDKVYFAAAEAVLVAIDARTGKEAWAAKVDDYRKGYYLTLAPLVIDGKVLLGASGGELGARGFLAAFDAETGKEAARAQFTA